MSRTNVAITTSGGHAHAAALPGLPPRLLNSGSSEIRNRPVVAGDAVTGLAPRRRDSIPSYSTAAGTGTGLGFNLWA
jgi:hypothetical protein